MGRIYSLNWDYNHSGDMERDAFHVKFENSDKSSIMFLNPRYQNKLPKRVLLRANFEVIPNIDYPLTDLNVPIFSNKMISVIERVGAFEKILTPVIMVDDTYLGEVLNESGQIKPEVLTNSEYKAITIINREDCFDYDNSEFDPSELNPNIPGYIKTTVLKNSIHLPPIFRIKESPSKLFLTEITKNALELNDIVGCVFEEIDTSSNIT